MSYMRDRDSMVRGIGAIAAADARSPKRQAARRARAAVMRKIDARRAMLAHGPNRKLPVAMGAIKSASTGQLQSMFAPTIKSGGILEAPPNGPYGKPTFVQPVPTPPKPPTKPPPLPPFTKPPLTSKIPTNFVRYPSATVALPGSNSTPVTDTGTTVIVDPVPGAGSASTGTTTGGGGGGGGEWTFPGDDDEMPDLTPPDTSVEEPPTTASNTGRNLLLLGAGIGLLYLLTRDHD